MPDMQVAGVKRYAVAMAVLAVIILSIAVLLTYRQPEEPKDGKIRAAASFYPLAHFIEKTGGEHIDVLDLVPPGAESHDFEPTPRDIRRVVASKLFVYLGAGFDPWAERIAPELARAGVTTVRISDRFTLKETEEEGHEGNEHGPLDPHIWLDPGLASQMADILRDKLIELDPVNAAYYKENARRFKAELQKLDDQFKSTLSSCARRDIIVSHEAFSYFGRRYNLNIFPVTGVFSGEEPSPRRMAEVSKLMKNMGIRYIFTEPLGNPRTARTIARETGATVLTLNPIEGLTPDEKKSGKDYISIMRENLANLKTALDCR